MKTGIIDMIIQEPAQFINEFIESINALIQKKNSMHELFQESNVCFWLSVLWAFLLQIRSAGRRSRKHSSAKLLWEAFHGCFDVQKFLGHICLVMRSHFLSSVMELQMALFALIPMSAWKPQWEQSLKKAATTSLS